MRKFLSTLLLVLGNIILWGGIFAALLKIDMCFSPNFGYWLLWLILFIAVGLGLIKWAKHISSSPKIEAAIKEEMPMKKDVHEHSSIVSDTSKKDRKELWIKIGLAILIAGYCCLIGISLCCLNYHYNAIFYVPFYLTVMIWYIYLVWRKQSSTGEDYFMLPLLQRIGLYKVCESQYEIRKSLLITFVPLYVGTLFISSIVALLNQLICPGGNGSGYDDDITIGSIILFIPVIAWVIFFGYSYGKQWLNSSKLIDKKNG